MMPGGGPSKSKTRRLRLNQLKLQAGEARVIEKVKSLRVKCGTNFAMMTTILDDVHRGHHGAYERGLSHGVSMFYLTATSTLAATTPPDVRHELVELRAKID
ncbi:uncharacterized protein A4U43_C05F19100 [Asparagus officinalis]|uniref:Uncharacterized protein n=1 Tax=Asparagus officinalis TaxID=4686 RepID=A0A5P1ESV9_ASPOF|nr:uncharacterized protein A4U43_C05F19100 [Asparagus officinalis]